MLPREAAPVPETAWRDRPAPTDMTDDDAENLLAELRWPDGVVCPCCGGTRVYKLDIAAIRRRRYKCRACRRQFSVTKGTILEGSKLPLADWVRAVRLLCEDPDGAGVADLRRELGVSYKTAQNAIDRICYAMKREPLRSLSARRSQP